jgi:RimJ/RimL family protein N-acetyltransferase
MLQPITLRGKFAGLEPLETHHVEALGDAASDGELWNLKVTTVPSRQGMANYVQTALNNQAAGEQQAFVIKRLADDKVVGCTRYYQINLENRNLSIGFTWHAESVQRTAINTECKLLLLTHAFEELKCIGVAFHVDDTNLKSQTAVQRLGATKEGILRNHMIMPDGRFRHTHCYSIIDTEWPAVKPKLIDRLTKG